MADLQVTLKELASQDLRRVVILFDEAGSPVLVEYLTTMRLDGVSVDLPERATAIEAQDMTPEYTAVLAAVRDGNLDNVKQRIHEEITRPKGQDPKGPTRIDDEKTPTAGELEAVRR